MSPGNLHIGTKRKTQVRNSQKQWQWIPSASLSHCESYAQGNHHNLICHIWQQNENPMMVCHIQIAVIRLDDTAKHCNVSAMPK